MKLRSPFAAISGYQTRRSSPETSAGGPEVVEGGDAQSAGLPSAQNQARGKQPQQRVGREQDELVGQDRAAEPEEDPVRVRGEIRHCCADVTRTREALRFEAAVSVEQGLPELAAWVEGQRAPESGDEAVAELRARGLVA
jgi:hypothetical protein